MKTKPKKTRISLTMPTTYIEAMNQLVESGLYVNPQEVAREGIRRVLGGYGIKPFSFISDHSSDDNDLT